MSDKLCISESYLLLSCSMCRPHDCFVCLPIDAVVKIWDTRSGAAVTKLTGHADVILAMDTIFGKDLSYILTASDDGIVKRFDVSRDGCLCTVIFRRLSQKNLKLPNAMMI